MTKTDVIPIILSVLSLTSFASVLTSCSDPGPRLTDSQTQLNVFRRGVDTDDPNYPLEVIEDGYKMIRLYQTLPRKTNTTEIPAEWMIEWGWLIKVKNKSPRDVRVTVSYILEDKDQFELDNRTNENHPKYIKAGDTETIRETSNMGYHNAQRVAQSRWRITYEYVGESTSSSIPPTDTPGDESTSPRQTMGYVIHLRDRTEIGTPNYYENKDQLYYEQAGGRVGVSPKGVALIENLTTCTHKQYNSFHKPGLDIREALLGHWVTESGSTHYYFGYNSLLMIDGKRKECMLYKVVVSDPKRNLLEIQVTTQYNKGHEKRISFSADKKRIVTTVEISGRQVTNRWYYVGS